MASQQRIDAALDAVTNLINMHVSLATERGVNTPEYRATLIASDDRISIFIARMMELHSDIYDWVAWGVELEDSQSRG